MRKLILALSLLASPAWALPPTSSVPAISQLSGNPTGAWSALGSMPTANLPLVVPHTAVMFKSGITPSRHLAKFQLSAIPVVCTIGDSTWSSADNVDPHDLLGAKVQQALIEAYPEKTITFKDFSIGGHNLQDVHNTITSGYTPPWYTSSSNTWNSYVAAAGCTTLLVDFGVNDTGYQSGWSYQTFFNDLKAWPSMPDIVLFTNAIASPLAALPYSSASYQAGYIANGSLMRTLASSGHNYGVTGIPPIGIVDINRLFAMTVLGKDPAVQTLSWDVYSTAPITGITSFPYTFDTTPGGNFSYSVTLNNGAAITAQGNTAITLSYANSLGANVGSTPNFAVIYPVSGTIAYVNLYDGTNAYSTSGNPNNWSTGSNTITLSGINSRLTLAINGVTAWDVYYPRSTTTFTPVININNPPTSGVSMTVNKYAIGTPLAYTPSISIANCYGISTGPNSGNAINHDSSACLATVYQRAIDGTTWRDGLPVSTVRVISTGSADTITTADIGGLVKWSSSTATAKVETLLACTAGLAGRTLSIKDGAGSAAAYPLTITPTAGTIDSSASFAITTSKQGVTMICDGISDWVLN